MKQIGARQEAGRIGGTGPCGRELCCATWMKNFSSVSTGAARYQDISLNPQKLAGMCAKLKCCLNYEVDDYMEAGKKLPSKDMILETQDGEYHLFKTDILAGLCTYSTDKNIAANLETITAERAIEVYEMNRKGEKPATLSTGEGATMQNKPIDLLADADLNRFDKENRKKKGGKGKQNKQGGKKQDGKSARGGNKPKQQKEKTSNAARQDKPSNANKPEKSKKPQQNGNKEQHPNNGNHRKERQPKGNRPPRQNNGDKPTQQQHNNENKQ
jgi:hypothetical protein